MAIVFREIGNQTSWDPERYEGEDWLPNGEVRGDALKGLRTTDNRLSVYIIQATEQVDRVIGAFCALRGKVQNIDYAIFDETLLAEINILLDSVPAKLPDSEVSLWHRDLIQLTGGKVLDLARKIQAHAEISRSSDKDVGKLINRLIAASLIDTSKLDPKLLEDLQQPKYQP